MATRRSASVPQEGEPALPPGTAFRELRARDLREVVAIERVVFNTPWDASAFRSFLPPGQAFSWVALVDGRLAGYALGWCVAGEAELMNLAVDPRWRRLALGSSLLRRTLQTCARRGASEIFLEVRASNEVAQRLYRAHGFEPCGRRRHYYSNPREDALVYRAPLEPPRTSPPSRCD